MSLKLVWKKCFKCGIKFKGLVCPNCNKSNLTKCPYCKSLFDITIGEKFRAGEIKNRWGEE